MATGPKAMDPSDGRVDGGGKEKEEMEVEKEPMELQVARKMLHRRMKVEVTDGRIIVGIFECIDKQGNIILGNAVERYRNAELSPTKEVTTDEDGLIKGNTLGLVMIPKRHRISVAIEGVI